MKNDRVMPNKVQAQKWYLAYFGPGIYNKIDRQTKFEVNRTQNYQFSLQKAT